jgi:hypothetical protein
MRARDRPVLLVTVAVAVAVAVGLLHAGVRLPAVRLADAHGLTAADSQREQEPWSRPGSEGSRQCRAGRRGPGGCVGGAAGTWLATAERLPGKLAAQPAKVGGRVGGLADKRGIRGADDVDDERRVDLT